MAGALLTEIIPIFRPDYEVPFPHIGTDRQLFLDNYILDHLDGVRREICAPTKSPEPLLSWSDLPWEQVQFNPGTAGVIHDPDDVYSKCGTGKG